MGLSISCGQKKLDVKLAFYDSIALVDKDKWNNIVGGQNIFLSYGYLISLEQSLASQLRFKYVFFYDKENKPIGVAVVQIFNVQDQDIEQLQLLQNVSLSTIDKVKSKLNLKVLICGNLFATGEHGFAFKNHIDFAEKLAYLNVGLEKLLQSERQKGQKTTILLKEFPPESYNNIDRDNKLGYDGFMIDDNMMLCIEDDWNSFQDYLDQMTTKYRGRVKRIYKKSERLLVIDFSVDDINKYAQSIERLYMDVLENADFHVGAFNADTFRLFKENLGQDFIFKGYFLNEKLVGFSTCFQNDSTFEASYLGLDYEYNQEYMLYPRMLYDLVSYSIDNGAKQLVLGRTSEEIKSRLGALPVHMKLYVKLKRSLTTSLLLKPLIHSIRPSKYELRHPFKDEISVN